jgi:uroporphyrinogen decarboxylase
MARIPLSLSVYEHAAAFLGLTPWEVCGSAELVYRAHREAYRAYRHFPVVVGIDIYNLEAEAYGGEVVPPGGTGIPAITRPVLALEDAAALRPFDPLSAGRVPLMLEAARRLKQEFPEADIRLPISGPFSIAQSLMGLETLVMGAALAPASVTRFLRALIPGQVAYSQAVLQAGLGVAFFESAATPPLLSPTQFRELELPVLNDMLQQVSAVAGVALPCILGGDTAPIIRDLLTTGTDFVICPAETDREAFLTAMRDHPEVKVRVNLDPRLYTRTAGPELWAAVDEVVSLSHQRPGLMLGTGSLPYETPIETVLSLIAYCSAEAE